MHNYVYVIALDPAAANLRKFRERNPDRDPDQDCVYVGQTIHDPDCRYRQHKECAGKGSRFRCICGAVRRDLTKKLSNSLVRRYGRFLRRDLYEEYNPLPSRKEAEAMEEALARRLRLKGHGVWWG